MKFKSIVFLFTACTLLFGTNIFSQIDVTHEYNILNFGAKSDGKTVNTKLIQEAIDKCSAEGGGTVIVPAGIYITGMIYLKDNVTFDLQKKALLSFQVRI